MVLNRTKWKKMIQTADPKIWDKGFIVVVMQYWKKEAYLKLDVIQDWSWKLRLGIGFAEEYRLEAKWKLLSKQSDSCINKVQDNHDV